MGWRCLKWREWDDSLLKRRQNQNAEQAATLLGVGTGTTGSRLSKEEDVLNHIYPLRILVIVTVKVKIKIGRKK